MTTSGANSNEKKTELDTKSHQGFNRDLKERKAF